MQCSVFILNESMSRVLTDNLKFYFVILFDKFLMFNQINVNINIFTFILYLLKVMSSTILL